MCPHYKHTFARTCLFMCTGTWRPENKFKCHFPGATLFFFFGGRSLAWNLPSALCPVRHRDLPTYLCLSPWSARALLPWLAFVCGLRGWYLGLYDYKASSSLPNPSGPLKHAYWKKALESTNLFLHYCLVMRNEMMIDYFCIPLSRGYLVNESKCGLQLDLERLAIKEFALTFLFHSITF